MNTFISAGKVEYQADSIIRKKRTGSRTIGDIFAVSVVGIYTLSALVISCWSAILLLTGETSNGGPIGFIFSKVLASGIL